ncbi:hypothetical protein [Chitinophaga arvensicola]|uniref:Outer membrane protein beta-barrel domain-containing protein n=1 Tax=Chitinophaga arvensicola TaxID=29529 RepID=A0A1I0QE77_9BACT|nr:hypothetical protein [Chitinophaga arvensicola]SEW25254.1 hypothetical protein SAMN04488122_1404 [Chitinophaga arvensicola]
MKKIVLLAIACMVGLHAFPQRFFHSLGFPVFIDRTSSKSVTSVGLTYSIRYNVVERENMSLSLGIPFSFGGSGHSPGKKTDWYYDLDGNMIYYATDEDEEGPFTKARAMVDIPLVIQFNFGAFSTGAAKNSMGFFAGGGLGYHYGPVNVTHKDPRNNTFIDSTMQHSVGPMANAGIRIGLGKKKNGAIELKGSYMKSFTRRRADIYGITLLYLFYTGKSND